ncbi:hypothetical protein FHS85_000058 [Rhodoligotrophos appendicifer]|uniref:DUF1850 domain-containing protein n=1 Tax=Rhodoligotrophos appendicifer TaxID=987056 RepID=UPI00117FC5F3|nr:DUF1850 domain-containing protein [Rhodoligotrophos appendicifer]
MSLLLCLVTGAALTSLDLPSNRFTLAWTHSVEKIRWEEDYVAGAHGFTLERARVRGSGAGMEPPPDAVKIPGGWWQYSPAELRLTEVNLAASAFTGDYEICVEGSCRPLGQLVTIPSDSGVTLRVCDSATRRAK